MEIQILVNKTYNTIVHLISKIRCTFWRIFLKKMGRNVDIMADVVIMSPQKVAIGNDVLVNIGTKIGGQAGVTIGNYVQIGYNVNIVSVNHSYNNPTIPIKKQGEYGGPIIIESDVWIGANAVILPKVILGKGSIIGANAVVTKNVKPYSIVGGVPAKFIKYRFSKTIVEKLLRNHRMIK